MSFQGIMRTPTTPVIRPPVRKEIRRGLRLEKSLEGETTLAATLVLRVATYQYCPPWLYLAARNSCSFRPEGYDLHHWSSAPGRPSSSSLRYVAPRQSWRGCIAGPRPRSRMYPHQIDTHLV